MEKHEKERIRIHLPDLIIFTICDAELLSFCYQKEVLSVADVDKIAAIKEHIDKASQFYHIIQTKADSFDILKDALFKTNQPGIVEILESGSVPATLDVETRVRKILYDEHKDKKRIRLEAPPPSSNFPVPIFDVSAPVPLFTGRRRELEELHEKILRNSGSGQPTVISQLTSISGLGGIGKTQLSRQYVLERRQYFDDNCIWFNAETESSLAESFRTLAKDRLEIKTTDADGSKKTIRTLVLEVYKFFENRKCLFIFDNAETVSWLKRFLPVVSPRPDCFLPYILITSRTRQWEKGIEVVDLNELNLDEAIELVKKGLGLEEDTSQDDGITKLVKRLQCFPLALQQAISYIEYQTQTQKGYSVQVYLKEFEKRQKEPLSFDEMNNEILNDYNMTTLTTWKMTVEKIAKDGNYGEVALKLLHAMAYLSPEKINREVFIRLEGIPNEEAIIGGLRLLERYSMVRGEDSLTLLSIHRLVQEVTRLELIDKKEEAAVLKNVLEMLFAPDQSVPAKSISHMLAAWQYVWKYPEIAKQLSYLPSELGWSIYLARRNDGAIRFLRENRHKLVDVLGEEHEGVSFILHGISPCLLQKGLIDDAIQTAKYTLEKRINHFGWNDRRTVIAMNNLGHIYFRQARFEDALPHFLTAYTAGQRIFKNNVLITFNQNLGLTLTRLGRTGEALTILEAVYEQRKKDQIRTKLINIRVDLGDCLNQRGDYNGALEILQEDFDNMTELSEEERVEMYILVRLLGNVLRDKEDYQEALQKHRQAYQESFDIVGAEHVDTVLCKLEIALDLTKLKQYDEAATLLQDVSDKLEVILGGDNFEVVRVKVHYAEALLKQGNKDVQGALAVLNEQKGKILGNGWGEFAFFKNVVSKDIDRIENDVALMKI